MQVVFAIGRHLVALLVIVLVTACGGGGGGGSDPPADTSAAPTISAQPADLSVRAGQAASFTVTGGGTAPLSYQWQRNGAAIPGATSASYVIAGVSPADSGASFTVTISNAKGTVSSNPATLKVPAKVSGILLQDEPEVQVAQATYTLRGELILELPGDLPLLQWKVIGPSSAQGTAQSGGQQFSIDVPVALGDNRVEVVAQDGVPVPIAYSKQVIRNAAAAFKGTLDLTRNLAFVNEPAVTLARVAVDPALVDADSVRLVAVQTDGSEIDVGVMVDNGALGQGDEVQGDGIYSAQVTVLGAAEGAHTYRAVATLAGATGTARSVSRAVQIATRLPDAALTAILDTQQAATDRLKTAAEAGPAALKAAVAAEVVTLRANADVAVASGNDAGTAISVLYKSGVAGVIGEPDASVKGGSATQFASPRGRAAYPPAVPFGVGAAARPYEAYAGVCPAGERAAALRAKAQSAGHGTLQAAADSTPAIGSNRVYALAANYSQWGENDDVPQIAAELQKNRCLDVTYKKTTASGGGSVEDFKNLGQYGMVLISSHGDTHYSLLGSDTFTAWSLMYKIFGWTPASAQVVLFSNMRVTTANKATYEEDLKAGRLVIWGTTYGVMPSFIRKYGGTMPASVVYMSICRGSWNNTMADAFIGNGAKAYLGYSDYVAVAFTLTAGTTLFTEFLKSENTLADAYAKISPKVEVDSDPAEFRLVGASDLKVGQGGLRDGDFESSTLGAWTPSGDGRVIPQLGSAVPNGKYMAIISTGLGFTTEAGSLAQTLCLSTEELLSYRWNFQSEEFLEYVGSQFQDAFVVTMVDADDPANQATVQSDTIDSLAGGVSHVSNSFDQGDVYATGWRTTTFTIPPSLRGKRVRLTFSANDVGDSIYDTAVLIDDVKLQ